MKAPSRAKAAAVELVRDFGKNAKRETMESLLTAIIYADKSRETFMRKVFHEIMLNEQGTHAHTSKLTTR